MVSKKILIVHPEGNINNNPNLTAIAEVLSEHGFDIDVLSQDHSHIYQRSTSSYRILTLKKAGGLLDAKQPTSIPRRLLRWFLGRVGCGYGLIIGVDREGIIAGNIISRASGAPLAFISYEILFGDEIGVDAKKEEINACRDIRFAVCQDNLRAGKLAEENKIPRDKIICVPVAGSGLADDRRKSDYLRHKLGIAENKNIALYMGSIANWAGLPKIFNDLRDWPDNWVLVVHGRYRGENQYQLARKLCKTAQARLYISNEPFERFEKLYQLPFSADIGLAFYYPDWNGPFTGKNLQYLGWASGKVATYLQCGLPVLVNEVGLISDGIVKYDLGHVIRSGEKISEILAKIELPNLLDKKEKCKKFFNGYLDFANYKRIVVNSANESFSFENSSVFSLSVRAFVLGANCCYAVSRVLDVVKKRVGRPI